LEKAEERFALGEIDRDIFERTGGKLKAEKRRLEEELDETSKKSSNLKNS
jgi:hypothetical protein